MSTTFNSQNLKAFRNDFDKAVEDLQKQYGVKIQIGNISFNDLKFTTKMTVTSNGTNKSGKDLDQLEFERNCFFYGFEKSDYRKEFSDGKRTFRLIGFNTRSRKMPLIIQDVVTNQKYNSNDNSVKMWMSQQSTPATKIEQNFDKNFESIEKAQFSDIAENYGLDATYYKSIYTGPKGGKYYLVGFDKDKGLLKNIDTGETCKVKLSTILVSLVRPNTLTLTKTVIPA